MDPKLWFWTLALANMAAVLTLVVRGILAIRAGRVASHHRSMQAAAGLVIAFLASFVVQRLALGPENLALWSEAARLNLRVHESLVTLLLVAGASAFVLGRRIARTRRVTGRDADPLPSPAQLRRHRRFGWTAAVASALGFATACGILAGMFERAG